MYFFVFNFAICKLTTLLGSYAPTPLAGNTLIQEGVGKTPTRGRGRGRGQFFYFFKNKFTESEKKKFKNLYKRVAHFELKKASPSQNSRELDPSISSKV